MNNKRMPHRKKLPIKTIRKTSNFCIYCGTYLEEWEKVIDHFIAHSSGDLTADSKSNLFVSCRECNSIKSYRFFENLEKARKYILDIKKEKGIHKKSDPREKFLKQYNIICRGCGEETITYRSNKRYCNTCKIPERFTPIKNVKEMKKCLFCNNKFIPYTDRHIFCSKKCSRDNHEKINGLIKTCNLCGSEFKTQKHAFHRRKFCSRICSIESRGHKKEMKHLGNGLYLYKITKAFEE